MKSRVVRPKTNGNNIALLVLSFSTRSAAMKFTRCASPACGRPFQVNQFTLRLSHSYESGKVTCPHCGTQASGEDGTVFLTHALSTKEEADFNAAQAFGAEASPAADHGQPEARRSHQPARHKFSGDRQHSRPSAHEAATSSEHAERSSESNGGSSHSQ